MDNHYYRNEAMTIISELCDEFTKEEMKLKVKYDNNCAKLEEMDQQIRMMAKSEDLEMRVFSPRRNITSENEKLTGMKKEREEVDRANREVERDYRYYSKRAEKLRYLSDLMERNEGVFIENTTSEDVHTSSTVQSSAPDQNTQGETLSKIQKRLDNCYHFIDTDLQRAKMELKNLMIFIAESMESN